MYNEVEVKAILIAVHNIENVGLNSKKVLLNSIEWLRCQYEITQDESFLIKAVWHIYAYLELGYPYISGELEFNRILNCLQLDINTVFPKKGWAYKKVALKKSNINQILGRWHPHFQSMKIEAAILDIIDKVENKKIGSFIYHCGKMLEQKDNKALWEKTFVLRVTEDEAVLQDVNKSNTYSFLFTGKYQEDMAEISHTDPQYLYDIKDIFTQNVIGQYSTDQWHENIIVFSDTYFQKQWEAMRGDDQEATVLRLFTFSGKRKENAWKELSEYQKECGVKNDSDTRMESYLYGTEEYLIGQKMRVLFSLSSKLFLMMALFISAFFVNGIKILSELSGYERRYEFLRCMGMKQKQRRKTIRFETQMLSDIALFATVMMGIVYVFSYEWRCASKDAGSLDVTFWMYWILIVGIYLLADRLVQWLFAQYVIKRVEKGND